MIWIEPPCLLQGKTPGAAPEAGRVPASGRGGGVVRVTGGEFAWRPVSPRSDGQVVEDLWFS